ncbi:MAG: hypothetical protein AB3N16_06485 [Flavobacteriaceae bacterium]
MGRLGYTLTGLVLLASSCKIYFGTYVDTYDDVLCDIKGVWRLANPEDFEQGTLVFHSVWTGLPSTNFLDVSDGRQQKFVLAVGRGTMWAIKINGQIGCGTPPQPRPRIQMVKIYEPWKEIPGNWELLGNGRDYHIVLHTQNGKLVFMVEEYSRDKLILHLVSHEGQSEKVLQL